MRISINQYYFLKLITLQIYSYCYSCWCYFWICRRGLFVGNIHEILRSVRCKIEKKKICAKENNHTKQYLRSSTICLCPQSCSQGKGYHTVSTGMCIGIETLSFRIGLNTSRTSQFRAFQPILANIEKKKVFFFFFLKFCNFRIFVRAEW